METKWTEIIPEVNKSAEFNEIVNDFGNPLELIREAISNAIDWKASSIRISFDVEEVDGSKRLIIRLSDDGTGMTKEVLSSAFWGLGNSPSRELKKDSTLSIIGEKGHGTKIYLRSEKVHVKTQSKTGSYESVCEYPLRALTRQQIHTPKLREIKPFMEGTGTKITIVGYNDNERSKFIQEVVKDYIKWFTKVGSIEQLFGIEQFKEFKVFIKCLDSTDYEEVPFGHDFPPENHDINKLFDEIGFEAADYYVKRFVYKNQRLKNHPEVTFDVLVSIEGDAIKREYNPMIRERRRGDKGHYKVAERYGIWLCKDFIPITRVNDWISGFGTGSNSMTLVHGFLNCQSLKLTANRGTVANTDPQILEEIKVHIQEIFNEIDTFLQEKGIYTLRSWQQETRTLKQETAEFNSRVKSIKNRKVAKIKDRYYLEPQNEAELFGLFMSIYSLYPELFPFEPLDYNSNRGIDLIGRNKTDNLIIESEFWYIELKYILKNKFNHAFRHLRWLICWDFDKSVTDGSDFLGIEESDIRLLTHDFDEMEHPLYFLDNRKKANKIQVIRFKEFLKNKLNIDFTVQKI